MRDRGLNREYRINGEKSGKEKFFYLSRSHFITQGMVSRKKSGLYGKKNIYITIVKLDGKGVVSVEAAKPDQTSVTITKGLIVINIF